MQLLGESLTLLLLGLQYRGEDASLGEDALFFELVDIVKNLAHEYHTHCKEERHQNAQPRYKVGR